PPSFRVSRKPDVRSWTYSVTTTTHWRLPQVSARMGANEGDADKPSRNSGETRTVGWREADRTCLSETRRQTVRHAHRRDRLRAHRCRHRWKRRNPTNVPRPETNYIHFEPIACGDLRAHRGNLPHGHHRVRHRGSAAGDCPRP